MQVSQIITDVRRELLETTGSFWSDTELLRLYNRGQMDYVGQTRILEDKSALSLEVGRIDYPLPSNWISEKKILHKETNSDGQIDYKILTATNLEKMSQEVSDFLDISETRRGRPDRHWLWNKTLYIWPPPKTVEDADLTMFYLAKPVVVTNTTQSIEIDDTLADAMTAYILWKAWKKEQELKLSDVSGIEYFGFIKRALRWKKRQSGDQQYRLDINSPFGITNSFNRGFSPLGD